MPYPREDGRTDGRVGLTDISYAAARNPGKAKAVADNSFAMALARLRSVIFSQAMDKAKATLLERHGAFKERMAVVGTLSELPGRLAE